MTTPRYEKPAILAEVPRDSSAVIEASAGTGKTYTLEHLVVELLLVVGVRIEEVLVVTFTERATAELRARVRKKLEELLAWTGTAEGVPDAQCWTLDAEARRRIEMALTSLDAATISTIHGFCQRVLSEQAFANGRLFGETQVDAREAFGAAFREELRTRLAREDAPRALLELWLREVGDLERLEALLFRCSTERGALEPRFDGPTLLGAVRACPLTADALKQLELEWAQEKLHAATRKALRKHLESLAAWCTERQGREDAEGLLAEFRAWRGSGSGSYLGEKLPERVGTLGTQVCAWYLALLQSAPSFEAAVVHAMLPGVRKRLAERKRELGHIDFDDMLLHVRDGLRGPQGEALAQALRERYRFALVDEFQDTDEVQWEVFRRVFHESGGRSVLYVIGDPKQAIYSFRGADVQTYLKARQTVVDAGGAFVQLRTNFRSTRRMVDAVNRLLAQDASPPFFDGAIRYEQPVDCGKKDFTAAGPDGAEAAPVQLWRFVGEGRLTAGDVRGALGRRMAEEIRSLLSAEPAPLRLRRGGEERRVRAKDIFVLTRTEAEGRELARWLRAEGVPVAFFKQDGLFQSEEAMDVRDVLAAIAAPEDRSARMRAWMGPFFAVPLQELAHAEEL
ncbi:MAG: UvrD-helicase domain-containing protein, partial [Myxococcaceae bacterium]|nr:UvrD-helicase domain-containing protein [Myxococcaceae bacterium]